MAVETGDPASAGKAPEVDQKKDQGQSHTTAQQPAKSQQQANGGDASAEKKLSGAELKKKAKEEKAARRAQAKAAQPPQASGPGGQQQQGGETKGGKGKSKQDLQQQGNQKSGARPAAVAAPKEVKPSVPECFSHLPVARRIKTTQADKDVHPAVLMVGQYMATFEMIHPIHRLETTLLAFKKVICT